MAFENEEVEAQKQPTKAQWAHRIILEMTAGRLKMFNKRGNTVLVKNNQYYVIQRSNGPKVFDEKGNQIPLAKLKRIIKNA